MRSNVSALLLTVVGASSVLAGSFTLNLERRDRARSKDTSNVRGDGAVGAIFNGTDWVTAATVGGQQVIMQIDTGSADFWIVSSLLPQDILKTNLSTNRIYDPKKSSTFKQTTGSMFNVTYDVGELGASGIVGTETVDIGGANVTEFPIGVATDIFGESIVDSTFDGTMGLGWQSGSSIQTNDGDAAPGPTFYQAVEPQLDEKVFFCDFHAAHAASIGFGFVNKTLYTGDLSTLPVNNQSSYWSVDGVTFSSGSTPLGDSGGSGINALLDTGGVGTTTDDATAKDYWGQVKGAQNTRYGWIFPCDASSLPDLTLHFGGKSKATIPGPLLNLSAVDNGDGTCMGGVQATANDFANVGFGFFATYFTVWDPSVPSVTFAAYSDVDDTAAENPAGLRGETASASERPLRTIGPVGASSTATRGPGATGTATAGTGGSGSVGGTSSSKALGPRATPAPGSGLAWSVGGVALAVGGLAVGL